MLSCNRCLICYCPTEIISLSAEERASPPPLDKAQTCDDDGANTVKDLQSEDKEEEWPEVIADCLSSPPENKLAKDLRAIFTLKNLLQVPQEELVSHLSKWGSPGSWISLCSRCNNAVGNAERIYQQILDATRMLEGMKGDIVGMIKESLDLDNEPFPSNEEIAGILGVTVKTREFVRRCEYDQQSIIDPFISGDLKANELLKLQQVETERVSKSSRNDEEEDLMEAMEVDEEEDVEKSIKSSNILDSSNEAPGDQSIFNTPPPSIQSPPKLPDSEVQDNVEEISVALNREEPEIEATASSASISTLEDMLADLDPFVKELLSLPALKLLKTKAFMSMSTLTSSLSLPPSVKQPFQQAQTAQSHNNSVHHDFDRKYLQENGSWRHYCRCGISYVNSSSLSRHITNMTKTSVVLPRNAHPELPQQFQCSICKFASPSVLALFNDRSLLETHLDQVHHIEIIAAAATKPNGGSSSAQILNNDGSFKDKSMELKGRPSFIPIQRMALAESESESDQPNNFTFHIFSKPHYHYCHEAITICPSTETTYTNLKTC